MADYGETSSAYNFENQTPGTMFGGTGIHDDFQVPSYLDSMFSTRQYDPCWTGFQGTPDSRMQSINENWADYDPTATPMSQDEADKRARSVTAQNSSFWNTTFGKFLGTAMNFTPVGRAINMGRTAMNFLENPSTQAGLQFAGAALPGPAGTIAGIAGSKSPGASMAGLAGSMVGGPALGQVAGGLASQYGGNMPSAPGFNPDAQQTTPGFNLGNINPEGIAQGLMQMYGMSQANKGLGAASSANSAVNNQITQLGEMYGPNSPYAAQLRQQLERRDAAAGRRSQYGPREVELQAALAGKQTEAARAMGSLAQSLNTNALEMNKYKQQLLGQKLGLLGNLAKQSGLYNMFGSSNTPAPINTPMRPITYDYADQTGTPF